MKKKNLLIVLTLIVALLLTACGASSEKGSVAYDSAPQEYKAEDMEYVVEETVEEEVAFNTSSTTAEEPASAEPVTPEEAQKYAEKIVYSGNVYIETTNFDESIAALNAAVQEYNGFIQDSSVSGRSNGDRTAVVDRYAFYVVRIPSKHFDSFMTLTGQIGNVTSSGRNAENVTSRYTDYEARLSSLRTQEERLLAMLGTSGDLESLIALEQRLSEVRYEIESIERSLRDLDQRLSYSTVNIDLQEVEIYTATAPVKRTFGEKLADAFSDGWSGFARGVQGFIIWLAEALPTLILLAVIATAVVIPVRRHRRKKKAAKEAAEETAE
ncbi:MAG: DUF4349 domain-containing protein [Oscillospiraceae bacterium]|nr:DUF4349 domain-containing protein [Oscillospiraceae bacterium]